MTIYKWVLGDEFHRLHPALQRRYELLDGSRFEGQGVMRTIEGGPKWLLPLFTLGTRWKLLFPERGEHIPFTIRNTRRTGDDGQEEIYWERIFHFEKNKRYFHAVMSLDKKRNIIKDYLGEPPIVYSDLSFSVLRDGGLHITSEKQRLILGKIKIPIPRPFQGAASVTESFNEKHQVFKVKVVVENPLIGTLFSYEGEFTRVDIPQRWLL
ncbi:DUF4166 domain-containing protein [Salibacterium qingdaonense]|uniref:DUF4166 domain-containing protein n=1 Tax=Salibacterium qingdaonense TaxID=266892 RepID=A0A1I4NRM8_9BACI|nr:DUF4166 domain-containing protein [Salibacterium qingdaonense]SFM18099.1 protein of unknown function [Salibacterium qingdaonense]